MENNGWIKLHRQIIEWEWYIDGNTFRMFVHLLLTANHETKTWKGRIIKRGQRLITIRHLADELGIDEKTVQRCLHNLQTTKEIKVDVSKTGSLITIRKYDDYQDNAEEVVGLIPTPPPTQSPTPPPTEPPTPPPTKQEYKNIRMKEDVLESSNEDSLSGCAAPPTPEAINFENLVSYFNEKTQGVFGTVRLPISEKRKTLVKARIREHGKEAFAKVIQMAMESDFLKGQNAHRFTATFDWLILPTNFEKVLSGNYANHTADTAPKGRDMIGSNFTSD